MTKVIVITSGKGGVGKTNISVNTAVELARRKRKVCLFDADLGLANVNILLGIHPEKTLDDYLLGEETLEDIILRTDYGFDIIPGSSGIEEMANLPRERIAALQEDFKTLTRYDNVIVDTSSGISRSVISFCLAADETILIITAESTSLTDAYALLKVLALNNYTGAVKILVNKCTSIPKSKETYLHFKKVADKHLDIEIAVVGAVIQDPNLENAVAKQQPVLDLYPESIASQCIRAMAINLLGTSGAKDASANGNGSFWERYFAFLHNNSTPPSKEEADLPAPQSAPSTEDTSPKRKTTLSLKPPGKPPEIIRLETPAGILSCALQLHAKGDLNGEALEFIISSDPALTIKLIQFFNATSTSQVKATAKIQEIIFHIGETEVTKWLLNSAVESALHQVQPDESLFIAKFWIHSYKSALLAEFLAEAINYPAPRDAFLAGLLHNIGRMIYQLSAPELYILEPDVGKEEKKILESEANFFSCNHAEFGANFLKRKGLGSFIEDCAKYHTIDSETVGTALPLTKLVYLAGKLWCGSELENITTLGEPFLGIPSELILELREKTVKKVETTMGKFSLIVDDTTAITNQESRLRKLARDHMMIQAILPNDTSPPNDFNPFQWLYSGMSLLFELPRTICLIEEIPTKYLRVLGIPPCLNSLFAKEVEISLESKHSVIVQAFQQRKTITAHLEKGRNLADEQILNAIEAEMLFCIPMVEKEESRGVLVIGIQRSEMDRIADIQEQLKHYTLLTTRLLPPKTHS